MIEAEHVITLVFYGVLVAASAVGLVLLTITLFRWIQRPQEALEPGICECGHRRSSHSGGRYSCQVRWSGLGGMTLCPCTVYIKAKSPDPSQDPSVQALERMYKS